MKFFKRLSLALQKSWWSSQSHGFLRPFSGLFSIILSIRYQLYRWGIFKTRRLPVRVIVVGNIVVGGVGKTPLVLFLADLLKAWGRQPGIISRGYGRKTKGIYEVQSPYDAAVYGDEPILLKTRAQVPVFVGENRYDTGMALLDAYPDCDVVICDDGLQHLALLADLKIAVFDERGAGNHQLLPAGPLREPLSRLKGIDAIVINGQCDHPAYFPEDLPVFEMRLAPLDFRQVGHLQVKVPLTHFRFQQVTAIAGIGHPARFFNTLDQLEIAHSDHVFDDHHLFVLSDLDKLPTPLLMTEKDAVKCRDFSQNDWWYLAIGAKFSPAWITWCLMHTATLDCLVCPLCKGKLIYDAAQQTLTCRADRLVFPIREGIPVMLESAAIKMGNEEGECLNG